MKRAKNKETGRATFLRGPTCFKKKEDVSPHAWEGKQISKSFVDETLIIYKPLYQLSISLEVDFGKMAYITYSNPNANTPSEFYCEIQHNYRTLTPHLCVFYTKLH